MNTLTPEILDLALGLVADQLEQSGAEVETLVVCGGSALVALGFVNRATKDVDVLAGVDAVQGLVDPRPLSAAMSTAVDAVGRQLSLPQGWLNTGPASQVLMGLPDGFLSRLIRRDYGPRLVIWYPDRYDLIHLKLFAVIDQGEGRHVSDLKLLCPDDQEMLAAARWVLTQDAGEVFPSLVSDALHHLGFSHVAGEL